MKFNPFNAAIAIGISALVSYGLHQIDSFNRDLVALGGFAFLCPSLVAAIAGTFEQPRTTVNMRVFFWFSSLAALGSNLGFALFGNSIASYTITNGTLFLLTLLAARGIHTARQ